MTGLLLSLLPFPQQFFLQSHFSHKSDPATPLLKIPATASHCAEKTPATVAVKGLQLCPRSPSLTSLPAGPPQPPCSSHAGFLSASLDCSYLRIFAFAIPIWNILSPNLEWLATSFGGLTSTAVSPVTVSVPREQQHLYNTWSAVYPHKDTKFAKRCHSLSLMQEWQMLESHTTT